MLILRMLSGILSGAWGLLGTKERRKKFEVSPRSRFQPEPTTYIPTTAMPTPLTLKVAERVTKLHRAAEWHAKAARKAIEFLGDSAFLEGDGVVEHMRHFRRYSSQCRDKWGGIPFSCVRCAICGSTCNRIDMLVASECKLICVVCARPDIISCVESWTDRNGQRSSVRNMSDDHLVESAKMVRKWLCNSFVVNDDRIRMCGHVLKECHRRGLEISRG